MENENADIGWKEEIHRVTDLIREHWALLSLATVFLSVVTMHVYLVEVGVPLSMTSSDVISGLPVLFILIVYSFTVLSLAAAAPAIILLGESGENEVCIIDKFRAYSGAFLGGRLVLFWVLSALLATVISASLVTWEEVVIFLGYNLLFAVILSIYFVFQCIFVFIMQPHEWAAILKWRWGSFLGSAFLQVLVMTSMVAVAGAKGNADVVSQFLTFMGVMVLVSGFQAASVYMAWEAKKNPKLFMPIVAMLSCMVFFICLVPPVNRAFAGYALASSATGGRDCVVFGWAKNAEILPIIRREGDAELSVDLKVVMSTNHVFYARPAGKEVVDEIYLVPRETVAKVSSCAN